MAEQYPYTQAKRDADVTRESSPEFAETLARADEDRAQRASTPDDAGRAAVDSTIRRGLAIDRRKKTVSGKRR